MSAAGERLHPERVGILLYLNPMVLFLGNVLWLVPWLMPWWFVFVPAVLLVGGGVALVQGVLAFHARASGRAVWRHHAASAVLALVGWLITYGLMSWWWDVVASV